MNKLRSGVIHFRSQRGSLEESLATTVTLQTRAELIAHLRQALAPLRVTERDVKVRYYTFDERINWPTFIVTVGDAVAGFTDGKI